MEERQQLRERIERLEAVLAALQTHAAAQQTQLAQQQARIAELEEELRRRGKRYRPKPNTLAQPPKGPDRRRRPHRRHGGFFRAPPHVDAQSVEDVQVEQCPHCGGGDLEPTGQYTEHVVEDLPPPRVEQRCYRRHEFRCRHCHKTSQGRGDLEEPGAHLGPRVRLLVCYARAHLGLSLGKTTALLAELFGLSLSRAGALGHLAWGSRLCAPVVEQLQELLREAEVVHADETGWRINGKNVWAWCFSNAKLALFLIDERRSRAVLQAALGDSFQGTLVSDFYAVYNDFAPRQQRCLVHLLRDLRQLREELPASAVRSFVQPAMTLFQDAIRLGQERPACSGPQFQQRLRAIFDRFDDLVLRKHPRQADCRRIQQRLYKYSGELFTFLEEPETPADNNLAERDIRSVAAARSDGGVNRSRWGATAFGRLKSVVRTCQKNGRNFFDYALSLVRAQLASEPAPLPCDSS